MSAALAGRVAIVTGSSSGIGRAIALAFHREGCTVVCADLRPIRAQDEGQSTDETITKDGGDALFCKTDMAQASDVEVVVKTAVDRYGRLDIFVNNAGCAPEVLQPAPIWETEISIWDHTHAVNSRGVFLGTKYAAGQMVKQEPLANGSRGRIINIASIAGLRGIAASASYVASKHSVCGLTKSAALDCAPHQVQVNAVCPGYVDTPLIQGAGFMTDPEARAGVVARHALGRLGASEDIASAVVFLASDNSSWITGATIPVDGGYTCQ